MDYEDKQKNIYDLKYQASLNYLNIFLVGLLGIWITLFFQTSFEQQTKWIMTAVFVNLSIIALIIFYYYSNKIMKKIENLKITHSNKSHPYIIS